MIAPTPEPRASSFNSMRMSSGQQSEAEESRERIGAPDLLLTRTREHARADRRSETLDLHYSVAAAVLSALTALIVVLELIIRATISLLVLDELDFANVQPTRYPTRAEVAWIAARPALGALAAVGVVALVLGR